MTFRQRLKVIGVLVSAAVAVYAAGRYYSPVLVAYVVEQTLIEKSPPGTDPASVRNRFEAVMAASPSRDAKLQNLLRLSQYLEKVQELTKPELDSLLPESPERSGSGALENPGNFFAFYNV